MTDEQLSAYADGAGDPSTRANAERALSESAELRTRLERIRRNDRILRDALDATLGEVPERLRQVAAGGVAVGAFGLRKGSAAGVRRVAIAASLALAAALGAGLDHLYMPGPDRGVVAYGPAGIVARGQLARVMATAHSGVPVATDAGQVAVALSFESRDGRYCRKFRVGGEAGAGVGVACHGAGGWTIEAWAAAAPAVRHDGFETASGPGDASIDAAIDRLGMQRALDLDGETSAIKSGWRPRSR